MKTAIVGAGAAGLSLALMLDGDVTLFEKDDRPGGLCRSTSIGGFTWDQGPHILGGIPEAVDWIVESTALEFVEGHTNNKAWIDGKWATHPFESEDDVRAYMTKMWKTRPEDLSSSGLSAQPGRRPGGVSTFRYPKFGGYQAITDAWAAQLREKTFYGQEVGIDDLDEFDRIVWTGPRPYLRYNALAVVTACCWGSRPTATAIYLPGPTRFHRISFPTSFSPYNAPRAAFIAQGEVSYIQASSPKGLGEELVDLLVHSFKMVAEDEIERISLHMVPYAYPVSLHTDKKGSILERMGVIYHGRTGGHRYINLDGVVAESMRLAKELNSHSLTRRN
jgi:putative NAD(P)-binding protein